MAVNQISFPQYSVNSLVDQSQWDRLAGLGEKYKQASDDATTRSSLAQLGQDPAANARMLMQSGIPSLQTMGLKLQETLRGEGRADEQTAEETRRWEIQNKRAGSAEARAIEAQKLAQAQDARAAAKDAYAQRTPEQIMQARIPVADHLGLTGEARAYFLGQGLQKEPGGDETGLNVSYGNRIKDDGTIETVPMVPNRKGQLVELKKPEGVTDVGPTAAEINKAAGKSIGNARTQLPNVIAAQTEMDDAIGGMLGHGQMGQAVGFVGGRLPEVSGVNSDYLSRVTKLGGLTFLNAVPNLKGMGALSDAEGNKITAAKSRAQNRNLSPQEHTEALLELQHYSTLVSERTKLIAQGKFNPNNPDEYKRDVLNGRPTQYQVFQQAKKALDGGADPADVRALVTKWGYDPAKWRM